MREAPSSATQDRVAQLFGLQHDGTYEHARRVLEAAGLPRDGCPAGMTWREVKQLSDAELRAALPAATAVAATVPTSADLRRERQAHVEAQRETHRDRQRTNDLLRRHGYRWMKDEEEYGTDCWLLISPDNHEVSVAQALAAIDGIPATETTTAPVLPPIDPDAGVFRSLSVHTTVGGVSHELRWRLRQRPEVTAVRLSSPEWQDPELAAPDSAVVRRLETLAHDLAQAGQRVLLNYAGQNGEPAQIDLRYDLDRDHLSGGSWWTVLGGPFCRDLPAWLLDAIRERLPAQ